MAKNSVRDFDATAANNTDIQSVDIAENCAPSGINNAIRELMADIKNVSTGAIALESPQANSITISDATEPSLRFLDTDSANSDFTIYSPAGEDKLRIKHQSTDRISITSAGIVTIGADSGDAFNDDSMLRIQRTGDRVFQQFKCDADQNVQILFGDVDDAVECSIQYHPSDKDLRFATGNNNEAMRIDSSGNLLVGTTTTSLGSNSGVVAYSTGLLGASRDGGIAADFNRRTSDGAIVDFRKDGTTVGSIGGRGSTLYVGSGDTNLKFISGTDKIHPATTDGADRDNAITLGDPTVRFKDLYLGGRARAGGSTGSPAFSHHTDTDTGMNPDGSGNIQFTTQGSERARLDSSGNLLVGQTSASSADTGHILAPGGAAFHVRDGGVPLILDRQTSNGDLALLRKDGTEIGTLGIFGGNTLLIDGASSIYCANNVRPNANDTHDLGSASYKWRDIYTQGPVSTSDQNEKQQISELTATELAAAKRISALFKTFKWNNAVEAKGDNARTHAGIIAQDVKSALEAEGLDATKYAFWCSNTWWESNGETYDTQADAPAGATERTLQSVRYAELMAFVGAATEQRLADIETRLTTLENA